MKRLLVIGGSDAGISAALRAREVASELSITVLVADRFPNYSICGLPFYLSGEVADWRSLAHRSAGEIEQAGIELLLERRAEAIDAERKEVLVSNSSGGSSRLAYDRLVIATGAVSIRPPVEGLDLDGVFFIRWMTDALQMSRWLSERRPASALIVGGGYIGLEMADALTHRKIATTVVEYGAHLMQTIDPDLEEGVRAELSARGVEVATGVGVKGIAPRGAALRVTGSKGFEKDVDMVIVATGAVPETALARSAQIAIGVKGAIGVDRAMATSAEDVFAAGDCAETYHRLLDRNTYLPLGTTAHKQGRMAGENAVGGSRVFQGTLGTQVVKLFDLVVGRTGLRAYEATGAGFEPVSADCEPWDHKDYYPNASRLRVRLTGDRTSGRLLGAQVLGRHGTEVSKRLDVLAAALFAGMRVEQLADLDLSYTPPLSTPWDPVQQAAQQWSRTYSESK